MHVYGQITGTLQAPVQIAGTLQTDAQITGALTIPSAIGVDPYTGDYEVTPSTETQTLITNTKYMTDNVVINPIPSNYGLITWDGVTLMVS